jgi:hypothetical protein
MTKKKRSLETITGALCICLYYAYFPGFGVHDNYPLRRNSSRDEQLLASQTGLCCVYTKKHIRCIKSRGISISA